MPYIGVLAACPDEPAFLQRVHVGLSVEIDNGERVRPAASALNEHMTRSRQTGTFYLIYNGFRQDVERSVAEP